MDILSGLPIAVAFGGMAFFSFVFSPLVFTRPPPETAGPFIRQVFPWYFLLVAVLFALATVFLIGPHPGLAITALAMAILDALNREVLMRRINTLRDRHLAGDTKAARRFNLLHRASVAINLVQLIAAAIILIGLLS